MVVGLRYETQKKFKCIEKSWLDNNVFGGSIDVNNEKVALVREGLRALIERESARRLAKLGGSEAQLKPVSRR